MTDRRTWKVLLLAIFAMLLIVPAGSFASVKNTVPMNAAAPYSMEVQVKVTEGASGQEKTRGVSGVKLAAYRVADMTLQAGNGGNYASYTMRRPFRAAVPDASALDYYGLNGSVEGRDRIEQVLKKLRTAASKTEADRVALTGAEGKASFDAMAPGIYLIVQKKDASDCKIAPFLLSTPGMVLDASGRCRGWTSRVYSLPKSEVISPLIPDKPKPNETPEKPEKPKPASTGDTSQLFVWGGLLLSASALLLLAADRKRQARDRKEG